MLMVLFSGTVALAHTRHEHTSGASQVPYTPQKHSSASGSLDLRAHLSTSIHPDAANQDGPVVTATDGPSRPSGCASGNCCCCNGASSCGMAGACHASAIPAADEQRIVARD